LANGNVAPARIISGQNSRIGRTTHGIAYDEVHDEIIAPNPLAAAVVIFRGGANGDELPARTIQGHLTGLSRPETVAVDTRNNEILVGDPGDRRILIYKRDADGNVQPIRAIQGEKTKLHQIVGIAVDYVHDKIVVSTYSRTGGVTGLLVFDRTASGNVEPVGTITGPNTAIHRPRQISVDPATGNIYVACINNEYLPPYNVDKPREGLAVDVDIPSPWNAGKEGFIGVWNVKDNGDVAPLSVIRGRSTGIVHPAGVAFDAANGEVIALDSVWNGIFTFLRPELFNRTTRPTVARRAGAPAGGVEPR
jgi:DNA-binding beta-propeller fold protein YncE